MTIKHNKFKLFIDRSLSNGLSKQIGILAGLFVCMLLLSFLLLAFSGSDWIAFCKEKDLKRWLLPIYLLIDANALNALYMKGHVHGWMLIASSFIYLCWEEAEGIARLMALSGLTQEQAAARLGKSPSAVANKLRLLKHSPAVRAALREHGLSERHARALLRLPEEAQRLEAVAVIAERDLTVAKTEAYIDALLSSAPPKTPPKPRKLLVKDLRLFLNSVDRHLETLRQAGIPAGLQREETEAEIVLTIRLPKTDRR